MPIPNIYDIEGQRGALGQQYVSATANLTNANNIYSQAQAAYEPYKWMEGADPTVMGKADLSRGIGVDFDKAIAYLGALPQDAGVVVSGPDGKYHKSYTPAQHGKANGDIAYEISPTLNNTLWNMGTYNKQGQLTYDPDKLIAYLNGRLKNHVDWYITKINNDRASAATADTAVATASAQYSNAQTVQSNAMGQYDQLKFQREKALNAVRSGRMQERLRDNPYKVL